jgi:hypothetical protein
LWLGSFLELFQQLGFVSIASVPIVSGPWLLSGALHCSLIAAAAAFAAPLPSSLHVTSSAHSTNNKDQKQTRGVFKRVSPGWSTKCRTVWLYSQKEGMAKSSASIMTVLYANEGLCLRQSWQSLMQMKDCVCTNHGSLSCK